MSSNRRFYIEYCLNYTSSDSDEIGTRQTVRETLVLFDTVLRGSIEMWINKIPENS